MFRTTRIVRETLGSGGTGGARGFFPDTWASTFRIVGFFFLCGLIANKTFRGNFTGVPHKDMIIPLNTIMRSSSERKVDTFVRQQVDVSGFADDDDDVVSKRT